MALTLHATGPLRGVVDLPGDPGTALSGLAFGLCTKKALTLQHVPESPDVDSFCAFLADLGAAVDRDRETLTLTVSKLPSEITIDHRVPDAVLHQVIAGTVFTADTVRVRDGAGSRERIVGQCLRLLAPAGLRSARIVHEGDDLVIPHATFDPDGIDEVRTGWDMTAVLAVSCAARRPVRVAYPPPRCAQTVKLASHLGCTGAAIEATGSEERDIELTRRLARARGARAYQTSVFEWQPLSGRTLVLPGDAAVAAALAACAVLHQRSKLTIRGVVWEQDRRGLFDTLKRMKAPVSWTPSKRIASLETADITAAWSMLEGVQCTADQSAAMLDEQFVLAAVAAHAVGRTVISADTAIPLIDRTWFRRLAQNLDRMGAHVGDFADGIVLNGIPELHGASLDAGGHELIALALACAALTAAGETTLDGLPSNSPRLTAFLKAVESVSDLSLPLV